MSKKKTPCGQTFYSVTIFFFSESRGFNGKTGKKASINKLSKKSSNHTTTF